MINNSPNLKVVLGPTVSGKTALGVALAQRLDGEVISADSRQLFRGMDIGTGKGLHENGAVPYPLVDLLESGEEFSVYSFQQYAYGAIETIRSRQRQPIVAGGADTVTAVMQQALL